MGVRSSRQKEDGSWEVYMATELSTCTNLQDLMSELRYAAEEAAEHDIETDAIGMRVTGDREDGYELELSYWRPATPDEADECEAAERKNEDTKARKQRAELRKLMQEYPDEVRAVQEGRAPKKILSLDELGV